MHEAQTVPRTFIVRGFFLVAAKAVKPWQFAWRACVKPAEQGRRSRASQWKLDRVGTPPANELRAAIGTKSFAVGTSPASLRLSVEFTNERRAADGRHN